MENKIAEARPQNFSPEFKSENTNENQRGEHGPGYPDPTNPDHIGGPGVDQTPAVDRANAGDKESENQKRVDNATKGRPNEEGAKRG